MIFFPGHIYICIDVHATIPLLDQVLLHFPLKEAEHTDIQDTLRYMIRNRYFRGNYRVSVEDGRGDRLVHWCHGAPGITITLCKAIEVHTVHQWLHCQ